MSVANSVAGVLVVEIVSADIADTLDFLCRNQIHLWDISYQDQLTVRVRIYRQAWRKLNSLLVGHGSTAHLVAREGIYWHFLTMLKRPVLVFAMILFFGAVFYIPGRVFFVRVEGNSTIYTNRILETAANLGIRFGASRRHVRSEQVKNGLLSEIDRLEWAGVNTKGCVAVISVREHTSENKIAIPNNPCDVVATRDGIVLTCDVTRGNPVCFPGQSVAAGQILISGTVDHGITVTSTAAEGEVFAATQREITVLTHAKTQKRTVDRGSMTQFKLLIGKKLINFFKGSGISGSTCVKMYSKYVLTLPGGFELPLGLVREIFIERELSEEILDEHEVRKLLSDFATDYLRNQMIAGRILCTDEQFVYSDDLYHLSGNYACTEMIGRVQQEQIGAYHGKTD